MFLKDYFTAIYPISPTFMHKYCNFNINTRDFLIFAKVRIKIWSFMLHIYDLKYFFFTWSLRNPSLNFF